MILLINIWGLRSSAVSSYEWGVTSSFATLARRRLGPSRVRGTETHPFLAALLWWITSILIKCHMLAASGCGKNSFSQIHSLRLKLGSLHLRAKSSMQLGLPMKSPGFLMWQLDGLEWSHKKKGVDYTCSIRTLRLASANGFMFHVGGFKVLDYGNRFIGIECSQLQSKL